MNVNWPTGQLDRLCQPLCHLVFSGLESFKSIDSLDSKMPFRLQGFQSALRGQTGLLRTQQRRWAQVHDVRFLASHHDPKYVLDKYRAKLDQKAKE